MTYTEARRTHLREWRCWYAMCYRCEHDILRYKDCEVDPYYTGQQGFLNLLDDIGEQPSPKHIICRKDKSKNFEPGNVYWITRQEDWPQRDKTKIIEHARTLWRYR